jgi:hypothetical protein
LNDDLNFSTLSRTSINKTKSASFLQQNLSSGSNSKPSDKNSQSYLSSLKSDENKSSSLG